MIALQSRERPADNPFVLPPSRQLLAHTYLLAAGLTGAIVGYTISRIEARFEIGAITKSVQREVAPPAIAVIDTKNHVVTKLAAPPIDNSTIPVIEPQQPTPAIVAIPVTPVSTPTPPQVSLPGTSQPTDDLELAARRIDERARTADRLGDPKLADLWKAEAARLRSTIAARIAQTNDDPK